MKEETINNVAQGYCDATYGTLETNKIAYEAFKAGVKWINDIISVQAWHESDEYPEDGRVILYKDYRGEYDFVRTEGDWEDCCNKNCIEQWAYYDK